MLGNIFRKITTMAHPAPPLCRAKELREIERCAVAGGHRDLMERAGLAAAEIARDRLGDLASVLVLAGPGNNGGDALVVARHLKSWWYDVALVFAGDADRLSPDAKAALDAWREAGGELLDEIPSGKEWGLVVDGLFGIGLERDLTGRYRELVEHVNRLDRPVLALDVPSGLDGDTGVARGAAVLADCTVAFIALKPGLFTLDGPDCCGEILLRTLGLDGLDLPGPPGHLLETSAVERLLPPRRRNSHKGSYGSVAVVGGAESMAGAALLAGRSALKLGAGRVYVGMLAENFPPVDFIQPELMLGTPERLTELDIDCAVIGPGLGRSPQARRWLGHWLTTETPLVLDADALNLLADDGSLCRRLKERSAPALLTPHPAEAARLLGTTVTHVQQDRIAAALALAEIFRTPAVLKGAGSVVALLDERWFVNASGNPGMASAGMGDVLAGMAGAFLAQGLAPEDALLLAVHLHGAAADGLAAQGVGPVGLTASDVTEEARRQLNHWVYHP